MIFYPHPLDSNSFFFIRLTRPLGDWYAFRHFQLYSPCLPGTTNFTDPGGMEGIGLPPAGPRKNPTGCAVN